MRMAQQIQTRTCIFQCQRGPSTTAADAANFSPEAAKFWRFSAVPRYSARWCVWTDGGDRAVLERLSTAHAGGTAGGGSEPRL